MHFCPFYACAHEKYVWGKGASVSHPAEEPSPRSPFLLGALANSSNVE
jgi:hypothetical protein